MSQPSIYLEPPVRHRGPLARNQDAGPTAAESRSPGELDRELVEILEAPVPPGETIDTAFRRKEALLGALFAKLSIAESRDLHRRLSNPKPDDVVAARFSRLVAERRARLLTFLADARRRAAIAAARR